MESVEASPLGPAPRDRGRARDRGHSNGIGAGPAPGAGASSRGSSPAHRVDGAERQAEPHGGRTAISILVIDVGTSSVRAVIVQPDATVSMSIVGPSLPTCRCRAWWSSIRRPWPRRPSTWPGESHSAAAPAPVEALGITAQRASAIAWDARTGAPLGPGLGWQDLRTVGTCLELQAEGSASPRRVRHQVRLAARTGRRRRPGQPPSWARSTPGWPGS